MGLKKARTEIEFVYESEGTEDQDFPDYYIRYTKNEDGEDVVSVSTDQVNYYDFPAGVFAYVVDGLRSEGLLEGYTKETPQQQSVPVSQASNNLVGVLGGRGLPVPKVADIRTQEERVLQEKASVSNAPDPQTAFYDQPSNLNAAINEDIALQNLSGNQEPDLNEFISTFKENKDLEGQEQPERITSVDGVPTPPVPETPPHLKKQAEEMKRERLNAKSKAQNKKSIKRK
jgi:hypothetical protein